MASVRKEITINADPDEVRDALHDWGALHRRLVWSVVDGIYTHHNASAQVFPSAGGGTRFVWIADLLPHEAAEGPVGLPRHGPLDT